MVVIKFSAMTRFWSKSSSGILKFKIVIIEFSAHVTFLEQILIKYTQCQKIDKPNNLNVFNPYKSQCTFHDNDILKCNMLLCFIPLMKQLLLLIIKINCIIAYSNFDNISRQ